MLSKLIVVWLGRWALIMCAVAFAVGFLAGWIGL